MITRGQSEGVFRDDLPAGWLLTSYFSLMHACGDEVRGGRVDPEGAVPLLQATIRGLFGVPSS